MELSVKTMIDYILHVQDHLEGFIADYGVWVYALLFLIVFCETGLVVMPFLPGDSLLFAVGALAAQGIMDVRILIPLLLVAAIVGDSINYSIGKWMGQKVFVMQSGFFFRKEYLFKAQAFYEKHGGKAIILARFVPIVRTFAPFVAGVGKMGYSRFILFNVVGAVVWVLGFIGLGYLFGNLPMVKKNMEAVTLGIVFVSVLPIVWEMWKSRQEKKA
jgi:membrane-associated protein